MAVVGRQEAPAPVSAEDASAIVASHPHLGELKAAGWDVEEMLVKRPSIAARLQASGPAGSNATASAAGFDLPSAWLANFAKESALEGYLAVAVSERNVPEVQAILARTRVTVEGVPD